MRRALRFVLAGAAVLAWPLAPAQSGAAVQITQTAQEHEVKAAFLFRFLSFIEWADPGAAASASASAPAPAPAPAAAASAAAAPASAAPIVVGFVGAEAIAGELERLVPGRQAQGRPVQVRRLKPGESPAGTHLVMAGRADSERIAALARQGALVVGEAEGALERGAAINFIAGDGRVRFEVSLPNAERSRVRIASRMLAVAQQVRGAGP